MNYFPGYYNYIPYNTMSTSNGLINNILGNLKKTNWSNILSNIQKTLNIVNQTIPMIKQVTPMINNAKTMFKIMNEFKKTDTKKVDKKETNNTQEKKIEENYPQFFI